MKTSTQCASSVKKANCMLGVIKEGTENMTGNIILSLYGAATLEMLCPVEVPTP